MRYWGAKRDPTKTSIWWSRSPTSRESKRCFGHSASRCTKIICRFVLRRTGEQLDFHTVTFDSEGGGVQPQPGGGSFRYPPEGFVLGRVQGESVPCISAAVQVLCHLGYEPTRKDAHDVLELCRVFDLPIPKAYSHFPSTGAA